MKRVWALTATAAATTLVAWGCGSYDFRLEKTLKLMQEKARLDQYLNPPAEGKLKEEGIYLRAPRPLPQQPADFRLAAQVGEELFDLRNSFVATKGDALALGLHLLGRHKKPRRPNPKEAPPAEDAAARGDFTQDVLNVLNGVHNNAAGEATPKKVRQRNEFNRLVYSFGDNTIQVYLLSRKFGQESYDLALIWEVPPDGLKTYGTAIDLCLQSLDVGPGASKKFESGGVEDEDAAAEGGGTAF